jgi:hypothetical protein
MKTSAGLFEAYSANHPIKPSLNTALKMLTNRVPSGRLPEVKMGSDVIRARGTLYDSSASHTGGRPLLEYYVQGDRSSCPIGTKRPNVAGHTVCDYIFEKLSSRTGN